MEMRVLPSRRVSAWPLWLGYLAVLGPWLAGGAAWGLPRGAVGIDAGEIPENWRLRVEFAGDGGGLVRLGEGVEVELVGGRRFDLALEQAEGELPLLRVWAEGELVRGPEEIEGLGGGGSVDLAGEAAELGGDYTALVRFRTRGDGTLFSKCAEEGKWVADAKALFVRGGKLVYDIGWLGAVSGGPKVDDGQEHRAVVRAEGGRVRLWLDGKVVGERADFQRPDVEGHVLKVGRAAPDFGGELVAGEVLALRIWERALEDGEIGKLFEGEGEGANTPDLSYEGKVRGVRPEVEAAAGNRVDVAWVQTLEIADHGEIVGGWGEESFEQGKLIYQTLCVVCHGTVDAPGSLPTAPQFTGGEIKNGHDPYSLYLTLTEGYEQMVAQPQYTTAQKYAVIHYLREAFFREHDPERLTELTEDLLAGLPKGMVRVEVEQEDRSAPPYERMDFGPALFWTYQISAGNIAQKGIAVRLDEGAGGVSAGRAWMVYEHDTMQLAAATTGGFIDWRGIAFDGSHGSHSSLVGERHVEMPVGPGWASPDGGWEDRRVEGRDGRQFGPLPADWARYEGLYLHGGRVVIAARVGGVLVHEMPGWIDYGTTPVFTRRVEVGEIDEAGRALRMRVAPEELQVVLVGDGELEKEAGYWVAEFGGGARATLYLSRVDEGSLAALAEADGGGGVELSELMAGGPGRWEGEVVMRSEAASHGDEAGGFVADRFPLPVDNPWGSWMRPGGFDFTPDGKGAVVCMWNGDVWRVDGIMDEAPAELRWRRIASGLFQPLGVKYRGDELFVLCRDQLVRLHDLDGDGEIDFLENFNSDHQVTEHFHEFAMGLQVDEEGNFYYAKSACHAREAVVPHHGTLLRVSADGGETEILASGFRAANGVCLNPDGSFFVTDQEGHWTPKNRINRVEVGGFYGNMMGYTDVVDPSDEAMEAPMVWVTNAKDRSPAELLWVPEGGWGELGGSLLNLSYGTGRVFVVPHEEVGGRWQGAVCELPMEAFETGIMRGRFGDDGALYTSGMFAWAGNATTEGGFYRVRRGAGPAHLPLEVRAEEGVLSVMFSEVIDGESVVPGAFRCKVWGLTRSRSYGSPHVDERELEVVGASLSGDGREVRVEIRGFGRTACYELSMELVGAGGGEVVRVLHGTALVLSP